MVLVQHGREGETHRGEKRGSEKQGRWGTGGEQERRERARPSGTQPSTRRRPSSAPPRPSARRPAPRRWRDAPSARLVACARVPRRCRRACVARPGRGVPSRLGASGRASRPTPCRRPGARWLRGWEGSWLQQRGGERWKNELRRAGGGCGGGVMDEW